jgi:hypothetical protein
MHAMSCSGLCNSSRSNPHFAYHQNKSGFHFYFKHALKTALELQQSRKSSFFIPFTKGGGREKTKLTLVHEGLTGGKDHWISDISIFFGE